MGVFMKDNKEKKALHDLMKGSVATWNESLHVGRGEHPASDDIQETVRHHRKDPDTHLHDEPEGTPQIEPQSGKVQKTEAA